jgi:hypothetical protein
MLTIQTKKIKIRCFLKESSKNLGLGEVPSMFQCNCQTPDTDFSPFSVLENRPENTAVH